MRIIKQIPKVWNRQLLFSVSFLFVFCFPSYCRLIQMRIFLSAVLHIFFDYFINVMVLLCVFTCHSMFIFDTTKNTHCHLVHSIDVDVFNLFGSLNVYYYFIFPSIYFIQCMTCSGEVMVASEPSVFHFADVIGDWALTHLYNTRTITVTFFSLHKTILEPLSYIFLISPEWFFFFEYHILATRFLFFHHISLRSEHVFRNSFLHKLFFFFFIFCW